MLYSCLFLFFAYDFHSAICVLDICSNLRVLELHLIDGFMNDELISHCINKTVFACINYK